MTKKLYNVDKWSEKDLGWKPVAHAEDIPEAIAIASERNHKQQGRYRIREKQTGALTPLTRQCPTCRDFLAPANDIYCYLHSMSR